MSLFDAFITALRAITTGKLRSGLTMLGLVIGVSSVILLIAVGQGAQQGVIDRIRGLGTDLIFIQPGATVDNQTGARGNPRSSVTLTTADSDAIAEARINGVTGIVSQINLFGQVIAGPNNQGARIVATTAEYPRVRGLTALEGTFITDRDVDRKALTIVLGSEVAAALFPSSSPIGQNVRLSLGGGRITFNFRVTGLMAPQGSSGGDESHDDAVFIPVSTLQSRISFVRNPTGEINVTQITLQTDPGVEKDHISDVVSGLLLERHEVAEPDFIIRSQEDLIGAANEVTNTLSILLGSVAGISLLVGAIGVMNIMLVSVTERTREIGIRRAVGARSRDIIMQFVTESLTLSLVGGLVGIALGTGSALIINGDTVAGQDMTTIVKPWSIAVAFAVAAGTGLISGSYPAIRAASIDPIEALRSE